MIERAPAPLEVAAGPDDLELIEVPDVIGLPVQRARAMLKRFKVEIIVQMAPVPAGQVIAQSPSAPARARPGSTVRLVVASEPAAAPEPTRVPALPPVVTPPLSQPRMEIPKQTARRIRPMPEPEILSPSQRPGDAFAAVDRLLEKLEFGNIAFNAPSEIRLDDTAAIQLLLGLSTSADELKRMIEAVGEREAARIKVSDVMEARLSGSNFAITAVTPERQAVTRTGVTEWKWDVKPTRDGRQLLHLTLSVLIQVDGVSTLRAIRTFDKEVEVEVTWDQHVGAFVEGNWQWLWATILVPIAGWFWKKKKRESKVD